MNQSKILLARAWGQRMSQKIEPCRETLKRLFLKSSLTPVTFWDHFQQTTDRRSIEYLGDLALLQASLYRSDAEIAQAELWVTNVSRKWDAASVSLTTHYYFQKGANAYYLGNYIQALEDFLKANRVAHSREDHIFALSNALFCLENLGLSFTSIIRELKSHLKHFPLTKLPLIRSQLAFLEDRAAFREGKIKQVLQSRLKGSVDQRFHFRIWLSELPYHLFYRNLSPGETERYLTENLELPRRLVRLRTFRGIGDPTEPRELQPLEAADRLYLWTWRWMCFPDQIPLPVLLETFEKVAAFNVLTRFTAEDHQMIRNAALWMSLLLPTKKEFFSRIILDHATSSKDYPLFEYERGLIEALARVGENPESLNHFIKESPPVFGRKGDLYLSDLGRTLLEVEVALPAHLEDFSKRLRNFLFLGKRDPKSNTVVHLGTFKIYPVDGKKPVFSESLARSLALLTKEKSVRFERLLAVVFGISRFDSLIHTPKVFNLISRLKKVIPSETSLKTSGGIVHCVGDWTKIEVLSGFTSLEGGAVSRVDLKTAEYELGGPPESPSHSSYTMLAGLPTDKAFTRSQLERRLRRSKSSTTRTLREWLKRGWIEKDGNAKQTRYRSSLGLLPSRSAPLQKEGAI